MLALIPIDFQQYGRWYVLAAAIAGYVLVLAGKSLAGPARDLFSRLMQVDYRTTLSNPKLGWIVAALVAFLLWPSPASVPTPEPPKPQPSPVEPQPQPAPTPVPNPEPLPPPKPVLHPVDLWARQSEIHRTLVVEVLQKLMKKRSESPSDDVTAAWLLQEMEAARKGAQSPVDDEIAKAITKGNDATMQLIDSLQSLKLEPTAAMAPPHDPEAK